MVTVTTGDPEDMTNIADAIKSSSLIAAEACFESDPSPKNERFWCNIWCNTNPKKGAGATQVQHQKGLKRDKKGQK